MTKKLDEQHINDKLTGTTEDRRHLAKELEQTLQGLSAGQTPEVEDAAKRIAQALHYFHEGRHTGSIGTLNADIDAVSAHWVPEQKSLFTRALSTLFSDHGGVSAGSTSDERKQDEPDADQKATTGKEQGVVDEYLANPPKERKSRE